MSKNKKLQRRQQQKTHKGNERRAKGVSQRDNSDRKEMSTSGQGRGGQGFEGGGGRRGSGPFRRGGAAHGSGGRRDSGRFRGDDDVKIDFDAVLAHRLPESKLRELVARSQQKLSDLLKPQASTSGEGSEGGAGPASSLPGLATDARITLEPETPSPSPERVARGLKHAAHGIHSQPDPQPPVPSKMTASVSHPFGSFAPSRSYMKKSDKGALAQEQTPQSDRATAPEAASQRAPPAKLVAEDEAPQTDAAPASERVSGRSRLFQKMFARAHAAGEAAQGGAAVQSSRPLAPSRGLTPSGRAGPSPAPSAQDMSRAALSALSAGAPSTQGRVTEGGIRLDPWQAEALDALLNGANVVVDAPTSAGKTRVIEALLEHKMKEGLKLIYTSPVKSLSNDKYREFCEKYGKDRVGINTGDFKENLGAPIILSTLETYRNSLLGVEPNMSRRVVVYDEYHYLQDESRGSAWEESIILTPKESQLVLLSASVPNAEDFAQWIASLSGRECKVIRVTHRPVPLVDVVHTKAGWVLGDDLKVTPDEMAELKRLGKLAKAKRRRFQKDKFSELLAPVANALELGLGPVVIYAGRRADVEGIAFAFARSVKSEFKGPQAEKMRARLANLPGWDYVPHELQRLILKSGVAYHHSGMIPPGRVAIETLLKEGLLRVCTGTMGISLGVNFAVRSAVVADESRPSEGGETRYSSSEVLQMLGRAGRRGMDRQGFSLWPSLARYVDQKPRGREPCRSSLKFDPTTVLGILGQRESFAYLSEFYRKSFFMRGKDPKMVLVAAHDTIYGQIYKDHGIEAIACENIPVTYDKYQRGKHRSEIECNRCPAKIYCHPLVAASRQSVLYNIVAHLQRVGALSGETPTAMGQLARHFPQAGGIIVAKFLASGQMTGENFRDYIQVMASFCAAHFKDIADTHADIEFLRALKLPKLIESYYPEELFPELYDELKARFGESDDDKGKRVFREFNLGAASIVNQWLDPSTQWDDLVADHASKYFSAGDCMMVLFRFSTFLQSCGRIASFDETLALQAKELLRVVLREPLDARNRMLAEETDEFEAVGEAQVAPEGGPQAAGTAESAAASDAVAASSVAGPLPSP